MRITIASRYRPYSHRPGTAALVPGSTYCFQAYPARWVLRDLEHPHQDPLVSVNFPKLGPMVQFTLHQDLEQGCVRWELKTDKGYFRIVIFARQEGCSLKIERADFPMEGSWEGAWKLRDIQGRATDVLQQGQQYVLSKEHVSKKRDQAKSMSRLSLGNHQAQEWELMCRRQSLSALLPLWLRLGEWTPACNPIQGPSLLQEAATALKDNSQDCLSALQRLFLAGFDGLFAPKLLDDSYLGYAHPPVPQEAETALPIVTEGARLIRELLIRVDSGAIEILPNLPPELHCGRFVGVDCGEWGTLDLEWTKKRMRRMVFHCNKEGEIPFLFPKSLKRYRLNHTAQAKGELHLSSDPVHAQKGQRLIFDRFES